MHTRSALLSALLAAMLASPLLAQADEEYVIIRAISNAGVGKMIGTVKLTDSEKGLLIDPDLGELTPGLHGFHVHEKPSCETADKDGVMTAGHAAGGHYDPNKSGKHTGPEGSGHAGDLPALEVNDNGEAVKQLLAPHLKLTDIKGHALMIHAGGDNYSDDPKPLGGGGPRVACGVVE
ncbi:superoxide dismutase, Cu-Zn family [Novimethylophilus kurashikiensis]|uniref:Superoxide dismutase [Cu-Zn] n=1 Tax=Novimethylophilus kurashikiensis TaxID=1825523 RepID=A0A2R5FE52_9PROT|nr:superoxide dismutase family protein [Novimethylophilus kurashikiensis]GBG15979.1 superoxide dismutase, Cu-Zn family [Novimethylophilus kurashikiensis]